MTGPTLGTVRLEPMRVDQLPVIMELEVALFGSEAWTETMLREELAEPGHDGAHRHSDGADRHYVVAVEGDQIIGYAGLLAYDDEAHVMTIGVVPDRRRSGVGTALLLDLLAAAGTRRVLLEVRADNEQAQQLYRRHGFAAIGLRRGYYQPSGADATVMSRAAGSAAESGREVPGWVSR